MFLIIFFFNDTATTEIYTLSLHDALPILVVSTFEDSPAKKAGILTKDVIEKVDGERVIAKEYDKAVNKMKGKKGSYVDRKSTRLNSSHANISYAVFCLKKKISKDTETSIK